MMKRSPLVPLGFLCGLLVGAWAAAKGGIDPSLYTGRPREEAGAALLEVAKAQVGKGSWERIALARVYYLAGRTAEAEALFDAVTAKKPEPSDWLRIGRVYLEAGEWPRAKAAFDRALAASPDDAPWLAEIGGYYHLAGEREQAEAMFARSFAIESEEFWSTINVAGSYFGVKPQ